jgi:hypothetical protein
VPDTSEDRPQSEQELHESIVSFYEKQISKFLDDIGGITEYGVKITPRLIKTTMHRYSQLLEKSSVTDWEQS